MSLELPTEILSEILLDTVVLGMKEPLTTEYGISGQPWAKDCDSLDINKPPLLLTYVCSRWRHVSISLPELWAYIYIRMDKQFSEHNYRCHRQHLLDLLLSRSKDLPLFVAIDCSNSPHLNGFDLARFLSPIFKQSHRWRSTILRSMPLQHASRDYPMLERLVYDGFLAPRSPISFPQLTDVATYHVFPDIQWDKIQRLACYWHFINLDDILPKAINLVQLRVDCRHVTVSVKHLSIRRLEWLADLSMMNRMTLPALEELFLANRAGVYSLDECIEMIKRSNCSIRKLSFQGKFQDTEVAELLSVCSQTLVEVKLFGCHTPLRGAITLDTLRAHIARFPRPQYHLEFGIID